MRMDEMKFVTVYKAPMWIKLSTAIGFIITAVMMAAFPAYSCVFDSNGIKGGYKLGVSGALSDMGSTLSYIIWIMMFLCMVAGLVFTWNDRPKIIPIISSGFLTFATIYSSALLKLSGVPGAYGIIKQYTMSKSFYLVVVVNLIMIALTIILIIKTPKKVELKFDSDE